MTSLTSDDLEKHLSKSDYRKLKQLLAALKEPWEPDPTNKPQCLAYELADKVDVLGFGGAAGGGKSDLGLGLALTKHRVCQIFRREGTELRSLVDRTAEILNTRKGLGGKPPVWRNPHGDCEVLEFGSVPHLDDKDKFMGRAKDLLWFDEASNFLEDQIRYLMGWVRTTHPDQHCLTLMTFNPPTRADGRWIVKFFAPWVDKRHPNPAKDGEIRYFAALKGQDIEVPDGREFVLADPKEPLGERIYDFDRKGYAPEDVLRPQSRTFIKSKVSDNSYLMKTGYPAQLQALKEPWRSLMLEGDFQAAMEDDPFQLIPTEWVEAAMDRWEDKSPLPSMDTVGVDVAKGGRDETVIMTRHGWWFSKPVAYDGHLCKKSQVTAGYVFAEIRDHAPVLVDGFGVGGEMEGFLKGMHVDSHNINMGDPTKETTENGRHYFNNLRSLLWYRMREALDPVNAEKTGIALPPNQKLLTDLTTPLHDLVGPKIRVEGRDDIVKRTGRSPDYGTAAILALMEMPKMHDILEATNQTDEYDPMRRFEADQ